MSCPQEMGDHSPSPRGVTWLLPIQTKSRYTWSSGHQVCGEEGASPSLKAGCLDKGRGWAGRSGMPASPGDPPGAQPPRPQAHEHGADQLPKGGGVHRVQLVLLTVPQVVVVE